jgi:hypothetical protein
MVAKNYIFGRKYGDNLLNNLVGYYPFNSNDNDLSGKGYNGTQVGSPTYGTGKVGNAINFGNDLTAKWVNVPDNNDFSFTNGAADVPFTISLWANFSSFSSSGNFLINKRGATSGTDEWQIARFSSINSINFTLFSLINSAYIGINFPFSTLNTWVHIVAAYNGNGSHTGMKLYLNGTLQTTTNASVGTYTRMPNGTNLTRIGNSSWFADSNLKHKGLIDELAIWKNRELTATEVAELYTKGNTGNPII